MGGNRTILAAGRRLRPVRVIGYALIGAGLLETLWMNFFTLTWFARAHTSVPWWDEWALVQDLAQLDRSHAWWAVLWSPYWGERQVVTRLLWLANARFRSLASLTSLTVWLQVVHVAVLIGLAWLLVGRRRPAENAYSRAPFVIACVVILNLLLSPFQMWDFAWGAQTMFVVIFLAATGAFLLLAAAEGKYAALCFTLAVFLAMLACATMPNGLLIWPVLVLQSLYLERNWRATAALGVMGSFVTGFYLWHYVRPDMGMGAAGMLRHPVEAVLLLGVVVGGPIGFVSNTAAAGTGVLVLAVSGYLVFRALRAGLRSTWLSALVANIVFLVLSAVSVVAGRLDSRFLGSDPLYTVPVRYPSMVSVLWACLALLALYTCCRPRTRYALLAFYAVPLFYLLFGTMQRQRNMAEDWADFFRGTDALGAAILWNVPDEELLSRLWPVRGEREERIDYLRRRGLAIFHEPRAKWLGRSFAELFPIAGLRSCIGAIEKTTPFGGFARVEGWAWDPASGASPDSILLTDGANRVIGQARGGLRHGYIPGLLMEPGRVPASHAAFRHSEWLGYVQQSGVSTEPIGLFGVFAKPAAVCAISSVK